jgi:hypothetical protein
MLLPGASSVFAGSSQSDFTVDENNLSISNINKLSWANCKLDDDKTVTLAVNSSNFTMVVENDRISLNFTNLSYPIRMLKADVGSVNIIFSGQFQLALKTGTNGNKTLWFDIPADQNSATNVSAVMNETYYNIEEAIGCVSIGLCAIGFGAAVRSTIATRAATKTLIQAGEVEASASAEEIQVALGDLLKKPPLRRGFINQSGADALYMLNNAAINVNKANIWSSVAKWAGYTALATGAFSGGMLVVQSVLEEASQDKWEKTPAFTNFADMSISRYSFGGLKNLTVQTATLASSMQIGFDAS